MDVLRLNPCIQTGSKIENQQQKNQMGEIWNTIFDRTGQYNRQNFFSPLITIKYCWVTFNKE